MVDYANVHKLDKIFIYIIKKTSKSICWRENGGTVGKEKRRRTCFYRGFRLS